MDLQYCSYLSCLQLLSISLTPILFHIIWIALLVHHQEKGFEADMIAHQTDHLPEGVIVNTVIIATIMVPLGIDIVDVENVVHLPNALDAKKEKIRIEVRSKFVL